MNTAKKPLVLLILDGWGHKGASTDNAIHNANTPVMDKLFAEHPSTVISGSGQDVGLPSGQMGNSEVGHINLGAGRVVYQDLTRISKAIEDHAFEQNPALIRAIDAAIEKEGAVHLMGLLSAGGVHSHEDHIEAMIKMAHARGATVYLHAFLDGRDTPPRSAEPSLAHFESLFTQLGQGKIASIIGRYYAMDRDQRWDRVEQAYQLLSQANAQADYPSATTALEAAYQRNENDEFVAASTVSGGAKIQDGDSLIFMNFRADRAREISRCFVDKDFTGFERQQIPQLADFVMLTQYAADIDASCAFPPSPLTHTFGELMAHHGLKQLRISETEKYAHVTFFYNGGKESCFEGEDRILIESPKVATYDLQPEMSSSELTDKLINAIESDTYDAIICNYPNGDMVGHTGNFDAAVKACEAVDSCVGRVVAAIEHVGGECLITADHGNAEQMNNPATGQAHTAHTSEPVPFIYVGRDASPRHGGALQDVAPTMLYLMGLPIPKQMTGTSLLNLKG